MRTGNAEMEEGVGVRSEGRMGGGGGREGGRRGGRMGRGGEGGEGRDGERKTGHTRVIHWITRSQTTQELNQFDRPPAARLIMMWTCRGPQVFDTLLRSVQERSY